MKKKLPIGRSDFKELREENRYFVDKSLFIKEIIDEESQVVLLPRPRRFGKTLNLSMLRYFFEKTENRQEIEKLFKGLAIEKQEEFKKHFSEYPVIFLTFKDVNETDFNEALKSIKAAISDEFKRHKYLLKSDELDETEKENFYNIMVLKADSSAYRRSLKELSGYLYRHCKQKSVVLIDEYDSPIHTAYSKNYYEEMTAFFRSFLGAGLKDNPDIFKGILTGILRIAKESIFSEMNNPGVYSILRVEYSDKFGFTEPEVFDLLKAYNAQDKIDDVRTWYNGYIFGKKVIYNPWSILNFVSSADKEFRPYWANTGSNHIIKNLVKNSPQTVKTEFNDLLNNIPITKRLNESIIFDDLTKNETIVYSFLVFSGYLKAFDKQHIARKDYYKLLIPNFEVKQIFEDVITNWINESYENYTLQVMLKSLIQGDIKTFEKLLSRFVTETLSYFDTEKRDVERVYQAFILGLLVNLSATHEVYSNKESGFGRYDISIIPKDKTGQAIIMELKTIDKSENETKEAALDNALEQIEEKQYETDIKKRGIKHIKKLGVVFDGKRVWIKTKGSKDAGI